MDPRKIGGGGGMVGTAAGCGGGKGDGIPDGGMKPGDVTVEVL